MKIIPEVIRCCSSITSCRVTTRTVVSLRPKHSVSPNSYIPELGSKQMET